MRTLIFGDSFFFCRTQRALGGEWLDLSAPKKLPVQDTLFVRSGCMIQPFNGWKNKETLIAIGATNDDIGWKRFFSDPRKHHQPEPRVFFLSAKAIKQLNRTWAKNPFFTALDKIRGQRWIEPQLQNWSYEKLRVLQVITSLQVGGAEKVCLDLSTMPECIGIVSWGAPRRAVLATAKWDLTNVPYRNKVQVLIKLAKQLHVDLIHTHLLDAEVNQEIEKHFPVITTMHNTPEGWPRGYDKVKPGLLVGCSKGVTHFLGSEARTAWNGISPIKPSDRKARKKREIRLIAVANYRPQKQLHKLPKILNELRKRRYSPSLTIVGQVHQTDPRSKEARDRFLHEAKKHKVARLIREVHTLNVADELAQSDIFISVSAHEGLSLSQLEALSAGLPVVATEVGGAPEIKRELSSGYITLPKESTAKRFADEIVSALKLPRESRLPAPFHLQAMKRRYLWLYHSVLSQGPIGDELWLITNNFSMGGAQTSAKRILKALKRDYSSVKAFTLQEDTPTKGATELKESGIEVSNLRGDNPYLRTLDLMRRAVISRPKQILFWNTMSPNKALIADAIHTRIVDVSPGEMYFREMERFLAKPLSELPIRYSRDYGRLIKAGVVKYSRELERMQNFLGIKTAVIPNGVTGIKQTKRSFKKSRLVFGTAARIAPHKRIEDMVDAFNQVDATFIIAGRIEPGADEYAKSLKARSGPNIQWLDQQEINEFLPLLDIFVMVSEPAGCPNASLEAMANGLPIIATDFGGANEQVIDGMNGWLIPPRNIPAMVKAIKHACKLPPSTLKVMARASLFQAQSFSIAKMVDGYRKILGGGK